TGRCVAPAGDARAASGAGPAKSITAPMPAWGTSATAISRRCATAATAPATAWGADAATEGGAAEGGPDSSGRSGEASAGEAASRQGGQAWPRSPTTLAYEDDGSRA